MPGRDGAERQIVSARAMHQIGDHERRQHAEYSGADAVEQLHGDQPDAVLGQGVEEGPQRQNGKPDRQDRLATPLLGQSPANNAIGSITSCAAIVNNPRVRAATAGPKTSPTTAMAVFAAKTGQKRGAAKISQDRPGGRGGSSPRPCVFALLPAPGCTVPPILAANHLGSNTPESARGWPLA